MLPAANRPAGRRGIGFAAGLLVLAAGLIFTVTPPVASAAGPPQIAASWVTEVNSTGARARAEINPNGFSTTYRFEYLTVAAYEANPEGDRFAGAKLAPPSGAAGIGSGTTPLAVSQTLQSLTPNTSYRYRPVATNVEGSTPGPIHTFTTRQNGVASHLPDNRGWEMV